MAGSDAMGPAATTGARSWYATSSNAVAAKKPKTAGYTEIDASTVARRNMSQTPIPNPFLNPIDYEAKKD